MGNKVRRGKFSRGLLMPRVASTAYSMVVLDVEGEMHFTLSKENLKSSRNKTLNFSSVIYVMMSTREEYCK